MEFDFSNFFDGFNAQDSYAILFITLIGFLFGLLVGYLLRTRRVVMLKREVKALKKKVTEAEGEIDTLKEQIDLKDADLKKASFDREELEAKVIRLEGEKGKLYNQVLNLTSDYERLQASSKTYTDTIEDLQNQIVGLKAQNNHLNQDFEEEDEALNDLAQMQSKHHATRMRLETLENKLNKLEQENDSLKSELSVVKDRQDALQEQQTTIVAAPSPPVTTEELTDAQDLVTDAQDLEQERKEPELQSAGEKTIVKEHIVLDDTTRDDLTRIDGIGPFLEKKLNAIGIYTYTDLSQLNSQGVAQVTKAIGYFEGRIEKDNWVGQAQKLAKAKAENPEAFAASTPSTGASADDLKIIEGIGPKIEQILKEADICNWQELAEANADHLRKVLDAAGDRFRMHDPGTWPAQARLAANGEWDLLREYQDELKGGRPVD